jgi:FeS assembly SUF system protein
MNDLRARVIDALRTVFDPEIPVNIFDLGLVYGIDVDEDRHRVHVRLTLTAPGCPVAQTLPAAVADIIEQVEGVDQASVELVWEPPWSKGMMSEAARVQLGLV